MAKSIQVLYQMEEQRHPVFKGTAYWTDLQEVMIDSTIVRVTCLYSRLWQGRSRMRKI
ncbi:MAG: hypothetical protein P857_716 [Candidatus Xenolissoclinum pacificiensis L6]|uniref:Uncharacterized protein n=1 Tax=Candidatus Xenolissoclinum pacificiensis L6 TaxID=1401685 RepID=W2UZG1_9RICK|nr:MAG: hypothetical protein P857_716 [Candidatus Xenolissoclinum pacificiensis L6]